MNATLSNRADVVSTKVMIIRACILAGCYCLFFILAATAYAAEKTCTTIKADINKDYTKWDTKCSKDSLLLGVDNTHHQRARVKICIEQRSGEWDCGSDTVGPGKAFDYWSCKPSGRYYVVSAIADGGEYKPCMHGPEKFNDYRELQIGHVFH